MDFGMVAIHPFTTATITNTETSVVIIIVIIIIFNHTRPPATTTSNECGGTYTSGGRIIV
jgi:hypothetical protein